jgi:endonuclease/exonuclease/phosphatase (EEP) superfamily protein YafD
MNQPSDASAKSSPSLNPMAVTLPERGLYLLGATVSVFAWGVMCARIMSDTHPIWDLASHLSWHIWVGTSCVLVMTLLGMRWTREERWVRWWHRFIMAAPPWLYFTWVVMPWTVLPLAHNDEKAEGLKIFAWNIWVMNKTPEQVMQLIRNSNADVVAIVELGPEQSDVLKQLESEYPYARWLPNQAARGLAVLSRIPDTKFQTIDLADQGMPAIEADIPSTAKHGGFRMIAVHTRSPDLHQRTLDRNQQLNSLAEWAALPGKPGIIVGDLNITPWSPPFSRLLANGNLVDSRTYRGHFASWPTDLGQLAIPIDHGLVTRGTQVLYRGVGAQAPDSDHRPITLIVK